MKINALNYVDVAERVILALKEENNDRLALTTSKIRGLLSMTASIYTDVQRNRSETLSEELQSRVQYLRMRVAYEAGRDPVVKKFVIKAELLEQLSNIRADKERVLLFCRYMDALVAYHRYHGGNDK